MTSADRAEGLVTVGVVGRGDVPRKHFAGLRRLADVRIIGARARDRAAHAAAARVAACAGLSAMLQDRRPGVLHILTPPQSPCELRLATRAAVTPRRG